MVMLNCVVVMLSVGIRMVLSGDMIMKLRMIVNCVNVSSVMRSI